MRITILTLAFVSALLMAGCKDQASQPTASTQKTINAITVQSSVSRSEGLRHPTSEEWKKATNSDKLRNGPKNDTAL